MCSRSQALAQRTKAFCSGVSAAMAQTPPPPCGFVAPSTKPFVGSLKARVSDSRVLSASFQPFWMVAKAKSAGMVKSLPGFLLAAAYARPGRNPNDDSNAL